uniref:Uncharacterized protein n=1 Tax=Heterorhabditis bacteriophora TaxID=37862 RepID=A0A1I7XSM3_HETBA
MSGNVHYNDENGENSDAELERVGERNEGDDSRQINDDIGNNEGNENSNGGGVRIFLRFLRELEAINALPSSSDEETDDDEITEEGEHRDFDVQVLSVCSKDRYL